MRWIKKAAAPPPSLSQFLAVNGPLRLNLDYKNSFMRKGELLKELCTEQFHLCGYTGTPLDAERLRVRQSPQGITLHAHVEHMKAQAACIREQRARGEDPGTVPGEDVDYRNVIAALEVKGAEAERFGATVRRLDVVPVPPVDPVCESRFQYHDTGGISADSADAKATIADLRLNHPTLNDWRQGAIDAFLPEREQTPAPQLQSIITAMTQPENGTLREFAFVIAQIAQRFLSQQTASAHAP